MAEKKHSTLAILDILRRYTDEEHILSGKQICTHLENEYGLSIERRTLYSNIEMLRDFGYDISVFEDNGKGYYLAQRQFDKGEVLLLCNAIHASHFISQKQSEDLIRKLLDTQSRYQVKEFSDRVYMPNPLKTDNKQLLYTISIVSEAIRDNKKLQFTYLRYDSRKKLVPRREKPYIVEPRYIVYADCRAYMIVTSEHHPGYIHYRLDRIKDAVKLDEASTLLRSSKDAYEYARNKLFMYAGDTGYVTFLCKERIMDQMIDIFGPEVSTISDGSEYFILNVKTSHTGALYLAQQFMEYIELLEPKALREEFKEHLKDAARRYK